MICFSQKDIDKCPPRRGLVNFGKIGLLESFILESSYDVVKKLGLNYEKQCGQSVGGLRLS